LLIKSENKFKNFFIHQGPAIAWAFIIFMGSSIPAADLPKIIFLAPDKLLHLGVFLVFGILVYRAISTQKKFTFLLGHSLGATLFIACGYGVFDEIHQYFVPGRTADPFDVLADVIGVILGLGVLKILQNKTSKKMGRIQGGGTGLQ